MMPYTSEKTPLLPIVERTLDAYMNKVDQRHREGVEYALLVSTLLLTVFQVVVLYSGDSLVPIALDGQYYALVAQLARGLRMSIPASLPTAAIFFIVAPYLAQKERVVMTRYAILLHPVMSLTRPNPRLLSRTKRIFTSQIRTYAAPGDGVIPPAKKKYVPTSGTYPLGFKAGSAHVGVKASNNRFDDLALIASDIPCAGAAVFTTNKFQAAPVTVSRDMLKKRKGEGIRAVVVNSGCANAVTGRGGIEDAISMGKETDKCFIQDKNGQDDLKGSRSIVMSTGVIGQRLPIDKITSKIPTAYHNLGDTHEHWLGTARAICTTDTFPKLVSKTFTLPSTQQKYHIAGMTKGAGMIHPNMATLLGIICTDAPVAPYLLRQALVSAIGKSFNSISIDGDTSTNDTVAILANGAAGGQPINSADSPDFAAFQKVLTDFSIDLAKLVVRDGEGATKFVTIKVTNAASYKDAHRVASTIARSPLVKTALYGKDANWGRILCATGYAEGVDSVVPEETSVSFVPTDGSEELKLLVKGEPEQVDENRAAKILEAEDLEIKVRLSEKEGEEAVFWTCDFSHEYVTINGDYRT
ncbi:arginine biosynthesis bifunctional protein [Alternaria burnsii]|uniref:Arginine biosynthesis bifunctional protein ArgJ, mitochondrial n=1 Tax=Alternaria burnsii TaxID=1187904 RepID=A0A8H7B0B7_9PLEO|nr:arginine biosynthesis bifunctional protein [Alternaria burnsii]KAF7674024.1 arginine biosynthesis bifunctional protein [Alternaria burnsii]